MLTLLLALSLVGKIVPQPVIVYADGGALTVTDRAGYVKIENDFYIANISKKSGGITNFYIKPVDTVNIVYSVQYNILGMHEIGIQNGSNGIILTQSTSKTQHYDTSVMYSDSSSVVVCSAFRIYNPSPPPVMSVNITEWRTFYADKPWFVVTFTEEFQNDGQFWVENQICFMYDKSYPTSHRMINDNGTKCIDVSDYGHCYSAKYLKKFMWVYIYNSSYNTGLGHILIDVYPRSLMAFWGDWFGTAYKEWQLTLNEFRMGLPKGSKQTVTYINYVANNETIIDDFASQLFKDNHKVTQGTTDYMHTTMNNLSHSKYGGIGKSASFYIRPQMGYLFLVYFTEGSETAREIQPYYKNSSGAYKILASTWTFPSSYWNSTYSNLTMRAEKYNMRFEITTEAWTNNDAVKVKLDFKTLATVNITDLWIDFRTSPDWRFWSKTMLTPSTTLINASSSKVHWMYNYGTAFKNLTAYATRSSGLADLNYYMLDNAADIKYNTGQSWSLTLKIHKFIRTTEQRTYFKASDFLETGSDLVNFNHQFWTPLPFPETPLGNSTFYINHLGQQNGQLIKSSYSPDKLVLNLAGESGKTTTWRIYCGDKGQPKKCEGATSWSYNSSSNILTITALHSSSTTVTIRWALLGDVNDDGTVNASDLSTLSQAFGSTGGPPPSPDWNPDADLNKDNVINVLDLFAVGKNYGKREP